MTKRIQIAVVEPSSIIRCGIVSMLQRITTLHISIVEYANLSTITSSRHSNCPDILIVSLSYLGLLSLSQLRDTIGSETLKIVALQSIFVEQNSLNGFDAVISIYDSLSVIEGKISNLVESSNDKRGQKELSYREKEIIVCVVKGLTNKQIADTLVLSTHTVISHRRNIANKLQIHSPSGLTIYAIVNKLIDISDVNNSIMGSGLDEL